MRRLSVLLLACLLLPLPAGTHAQQVRRCVGADGSTTFTDRRCEDIGAVDRAPPAARDAPHAFRGGCPRVLSQLVGEVGAAIQAGDVNRLAGVYDWSGVSRAAAPRLLDRLEAIAGRPLVDIAPVYPAGVAEAEIGLISVPEPEPGPVPRPADAAALAGGPAAWMPSWAAATDAGDAAEEAPVELEPLPSPALSRPRPVALRVEQTLSGTATPVRTVFGLRRGYGCFWISL